MSAVSKAVRMSERDRSKRDKAEEKIIKKLPTGFKDEADAMNETELRDCIVQSENNIKNVAREMENDDKLQGAKSIVGDLTGPYSEAKKAQAAKIQYVLGLLADKGVLHEVD